MIKNSIKTDRKQANIMGIDLNSTRIEIVLRNIRLMLSKNSKNEAKTHKFYVVTPNPEQILISLKDLNFKKIINNADYSLADGIGLPQAAYFLGKKFPKRILFRIVYSTLLALKILYLSLFNRDKLLEKLPVIHGSDFFQRLLTLGNKMGWKYVFLGGIGQVAEKSAEVVLRSYKNLKVLGVSYPNIDSLGQVEKGMESAEQEIIKKINLFSPDIVFVGFGAPKQEKWIARNLGRVNTKGFMVIGGTLDYVSGRVPRPPERIKNMEAEWAWRLLTQFRFKRVYNAVVVFPWKVFIYKLRS